MSPPVVPLRAVAGLFLLRQHLAQPRARPATPARLLRFAEDVGGIQMDSINVLDRAHYLTVWSRFGPYERAWLDRLVYRRRLLIEYWAHAACLVPTAALPWWRRAMLDYRLRDTGWTRWLRRNPRLLAEVTESIRANGPMRPGQLDARPRSGDKGWWSWRPVQHALHCLWMTGVVTVHSRQHFQKRFDLMERALPRVAADPVSAEAFLAWHIERSLHAMGAATETDLARYLTFPRFVPGARRTAIRRMLDRGLVTEIAVDGVPGRWLALTRDLPALARAGRRPAVSTGTTLLSPFDSLLWHRERVARLLGFHYRIEVYTPGPDRVHGYYTLPILHDGHLIGRVDAKAHRAERRLDVRRVHFEDWLGVRPGPAATWGDLDPEAVAAGIAEALRSLARFVGADRVTLGVVTPRRARSALAQALRRAPDTGAA